MEVVVTGAAGFIGSHLCERLLAEGWRVHGLDNFNPFYDPAVKRRNAAAVAAQGGGRFRLVEGDLRRGADLERLFDPVRGPFVLVHLAAMAGVRPSLRAPLLYQEVNVSGTYRLLEAARRRELTHYVFGSSSSVYGGSTHLPYREDEGALDPLSPYAATKLVGEQMAFAYHVCHGFPVTCLRFFTVYGPRQRPEMAIHRFARAILAGEPIPLYGDGSSTRDYTYVADIVDGILRALAAPAGFRLYNLGGGTRVPLREVVTRLEEALGRRAVLAQRPAHPADMVHTWADISRARAELGYRPRYPFAAGIGEFVAWLEGEAAP